MTKFSNFKTHWHICSHCLYKNYLSVGWSRIFFVASCNVWP